MPKIAFIGAGSVEFTRNLLGDILAFPALAESEIALHDIDAERLDDRRVAGRPRGRDAWRQHPRCPPRSTAARRSTAPTT